MAATKTYVQTQSSSLDRLLHGGLPAGQLSLIYGKAATGKTTIAIQCTVNCARRGFQVFYMDSDGTFPVERLKQISPDFEELTPLIGIFTPQNFFKQTVLIENLERYLTPKVHLVVVDTINSLYRCAFKDAQSLFLLNKELNRQLAYLADIALKNNLPVLLVSQVHSTLQEKKEDVEPVATRTLHFWCANIIQLKPSIKPDEKVAYLKKFNGRKLYNIFCHLKLSEYGLK